MIMIIIMKEDSYLLVMIVVLIIVIAADSLHFPSPLHLHSQPLSIQCAFYATPLYSIMAKLHFRDFFSILTNTLLSAFLLFVVLEYPTFCFVTLFFLTQRQFFFSILNPRLFSMFKLQP